MKHPAESQLIAGSNELKKRFIIRLFSRQQRLVFVNVFSAFPKIRKTAVLSIILQTQNQLVTRLTPVSLR